MWAQPAPKFADRLSGDVLHPSLDLDGSLNVRNSANSKGPSDINSTVAGIVGHLDVDKSRLRQQATD